MKKTMNESQFSRILVVDDEEDICEILKFNLQNAGFNVDVAYSAEQALKLLTDTHKLILLDIMMSGMSGYQLANKIKNDLQKNVAIIFLTAKNTENDMLTGFSVGCDDYIVKPFSVQEVIARVKAVMRRIDTADTQVKKQVNIGNLLINFDAKTVTVDNKLIELTHKEYLILSLLCKFPDTFFSREQIIDNVWKGEAYVLERTVDVHITRLRKKLEPYGVHIVNRPGFGYCLYKD
jgi:two-component system, OmpR family, alkaline phosphatase synthesis response regulator PhoP